MHAVTLVDGDLRWIEHPDPQPGPGEVLVSVAAAGINAADLLQRRGLYPAPAGWPSDIPGMEFAGEVVGTGGGTGRFSTGDRVMGIAGGGGQAELLVVPEATLLPVPDRIPWDQAGGFPEAFCTAHDALFTQAGLQAGERVLVSGAAGGVGTAAVQLAHAAGAHVVASVRSEAKHEAVAGLGADEVIEPDEVGGHGPYDVSLELVGAPGVAAVLPSLAKGGRIVVIGVGAGARVELDLLALMGRRATIGGSTLRARTVEEKAAVTRAVEEHAVPLLARGEVVVPVADRVPMARATEAYERFASGGKLGKIVLVNG
ncbi:MAG TPA: zinc-binding dehydrogenase [Acidimicrobiales bacterium]